MTLSPELDLIAKIEEPKVFSVTELSVALKNTLEQSFGYVRIKGEISGLKLHTSGHLYFSLKDKDSVLDAICWRGTLSKFSLTPSDGMDVICQGRITTYGARSKYQIIVDHMEVAGIGELLALLEARKKKLAEEGLFDPSRKKKLPFLPTTIGIITSPTGAVIEDILHRLKERFPLHVLLWPVTVQGENAAHEVTQAIIGFNGLLSKPDLLIVARGGGSLEDLWAFNEECVVRAAAQSEIPLISAIGHETDTTLLDYVADRRAPTPTAAAEMAVPVLKDLLEILHTTLYRLRNGILKTLRHAEVLLQSHSRGLISPQRLLENKQQLLDDYLERLGVSLENKKTSSQNRLTFLTHRLSQISVGKLQQTRFRELSLLLESYSYTKTLERGFVLIKTERGEPLTSALKLHSQDTVLLQFFDGTKKVEVMD
jgi:exodeoxyribonuclease VII large subunit